MELTIDTLQKIDGHKYFTIDMAETDLLAYTVHVDSHRILTVCSNYHTVTARWTREVLRCNRKSKKIIVGVTVDRQTRYERKRANDSNYELMTLCVGSHCLIMELPASYGIPDPEIPLIAFFADQRVVAAGTNMKTVAEKLFKDHGIRVSNVMDLNKAAEEVLKDSHLLDLRRYDMDRLGTTVMGHSWYINRPEKVKWYPVHQYWGDLTLKKVMYSTYDAYLCLSIGAKLIEMKTGKRTGGSAGKKSNNKKGSNN